MHLSLIFQPKLYLIMSYSNAITSDPLGAFKTVMASLVGMIPEFGPFLSLGLNLLFPTSDSDLSVLFKHIDKEIQTKISQAIDQENKMIVNSSKVDAMSTWNDFVTNKFNQYVPKATNENPVPNFELDKLPTKAIQGLCAALTTATNNAHSHKSDLRDGNLYQNIGSILELGTFHIGISTYLAHVMDYMNKHNIAIGSGSYGDDHPKELRAVRSFYANLLREAVAALGQEPTVTESDFIYYKSSSNAPQQGIAPCLYKDTTNITNNYKKLRRCQFATFVAHSILPALYYWEQGLSLYTGKITDKNKDNIDGVVLAKNMIPAIPFPVVPAKNTASFAPYLRDFVPTTERDSYAYNFDLSNPGDRDEFPTSFTVIYDVYKAKLFTSDTPNFEDCAWLQWGDANNPGGKGIIFDVYQDVKSGPDYKPFENLVWGSITLTLNDVDFGTDVSGESTRGGYCQAQTKGDSTRTLTLSIIVPQSNASKYGFQQLLSPAYFLKKFQMELKDKKAPDTGTLNLVGKGTPHSLLDVPYLSFEGIPAGSPSTWGAKIFDKAPSSTLYVALTKNEWNFTNNASAENPPYEGPIGIGLFNPDARFPEAVIFSSVLYQVDSAKSLIYYYPINNLNTPITVDPNLPVYISVNDTVDGYGDNSGTISVAVGHK